MFIGIDLGGTKIEGIALDADGETLLRQRVPTPQQDYAATVMAITDLVRHIEQQTGRHGSVGVGIPGAISPATDRVKNANSTWLIGQPLHHDLEQTLNRPVRIENDANCFVVSEATDGAAQGAEVVFGVIIGTGTGGGIYVRGRSLIGANAIAGEWGHNPLPWPTAAELAGPDCYCGKQGCIETWLSGPGFARDYRQASGQTRDPEAIVRLAAEGDARAEATLQRYEDRLARGLASVINLLDPEIIVLGGGMSNIPRLYDNVPRLWADHVFSDRVTTRLVPPRHGDSSGVRGAAWLWKEHG
jgi:fructokinase